VRLQGLRGSQLRPIVNQPVFGKSRHLFSQIEADRGAIRACPRQYGPPCTAGQFGNVVEQSLVPWTGVSSHGRVYVPLALARSSGPALAGRANSCCRSLPLSWCLPGRHFPRRTGARAPAHPRAVAESHPHRRESA
jgi:hypothetical protein